MNSKSSILSNKLHSPRLTEAVPKIETALLIQRDRRALLWASDSRISPASSVTCTLFLTAFVTQRARLYMNVHACVLVIRE